MRWRWIGGLVVAVPAVVILGAWLLIDPNHYKPQIEAAVQRATGRALTLEGKLHLGLLPAPTISADTVSYANPPGFSRPQMLTAARIRVELAWLPLLHGQARITSLVLEHPDLLLERNAAGQDNWLFPAPAVPVVASPSSPTASGQPPPTTELQHLRIEDGRVGWRDPLHDQVINVTNLDVTEDSPDSPINLSLTGARGGKNFTLAGAFGSLSRLRDRAATSPWPARLSLTVGQATATVEGSFTNPLNLRGYTVSASFAAPDLAALPPEWQLPAVSDLKFAADVTDAGIFPLVTSASLTGTYGGMPLSLRESLSPLVADKPLSLDVSAEAVGATFRAMGSLAHPLQLAGLQGKITLRLPDVAAFGALIRQKLPDIHDVSLDVVAADADGGLARGLALHDLKFVSAPVSVAGDVVVGFSPLPSLTGSLTASSIDLDLLRAAFAQGPTGSAATASAAPAPVKSHRLFPDTSLPFAPLHRADADLDLRAATLKTGGLHYTDLAAHVALQGGHLSLSHVAARLPGGALDGSLDLDASRQPARQALVLHAPGLAVKPLLTDLGLPDDASGVLEVDADLQGEGDTPHAIAENLSGHLGLAMVSGALDNRLITQLIGPVLKSVRLPIDVPPNGGHSDIRCFAARLDANRGIAAVRSALLDVVRFRITAAGTIDLGDETLAVRLRPYVLLAGNGVVVPLLLTGPIQSPKVSLSPTGPVESVASLAASLLANGSRLTPVTSALANAGEQLLGDADTGNCAPALLLARDGATGPQPPPPKREKGNPIGNFLQGLFK